MDDSQLELVRRELRLRREIAAHELRCMLDDDPDDLDAIEAKTEELDLITARQNRLEHYLREGTVA